MLAVRKMMQTINAGMTSYSKGSKHNRRIRDKPAKANNEIAT